jgi:hypothetical protein
MGVLNYAVSNTLAKTRRPSLVHLVHWAHASSYNEKPKQQLSKVQSATSTNSMEQSPV